MKSLKSCRRRRRWMVVYTTLAVLVETITESGPLARHDFGLKAAHKK